MKLYLSAYYFKCMFRDILLYMLAFTIILINLNYMTTGYKITGRASSRRSPFKVSTSEASFEGKLVSVGPIKRWFTPDHFVIAFTSEACRRKNGVDAGSTFYWACRWSNEIRKKIRISTCVNAFALCTQHSLSHFRPFFSRDDYHNNLHAIESQAAVRLHGTSW